jgi:hypothetical protein
MAASNVVTPLEGIILEQKSTGDGATLGKTIDLGPRSDDGDVRRHSPPMGHRFVAVTG